VLGNIVDIIIVLLLWFSLYAGLVATLKHLLVDNDVTIRHKATECLFVIAGETEDIMRKHNT